MKTFSTFIYKDELIANENNKNKYLLSTKYI